MFWVFQVPGVLGAIFGFIGLGQTKDGKQRGRGMAIAGVVIGIVLAVGCAVLDLDQHHRSLLSRRQHVPLRQQLLGVQLRTTRLLVSLSCQVCFLPSHNIHRKPR